jgi:hypothetical protein
MAAMAVGHGLEQASGLSLKRVVRTLRKVSNLYVGGGWTSCACGHAGAC